MPNHLSTSTSPYLLQHAANPVEWWPWGDEALEQAVRLDRPILVSIGYSSCHWCHVMAHESFADPATAAVMNAHFVNVKVDREERPDIDGLYMAALQAMTGRGGWPLNAFATPNGRPFYAGTYFPPTPRHGLPSWRQVLESVAEAWRSRRADIEAHGDALAAAIGAEQPEARDGAAIDRALLAGAARALLDAVDAHGGGFGGAPKFPQSGALAFLLRVHARGRDASGVEALEAVEAAMDAMLSGGLNDQLAGGFHRYCVDRTWTVPHYEKMLYDSAQLLTLLVELWQVTGKDDYAQGARRTATYLLGALRSPDGAFYCAQDADTPAGEGAYHTWSPAEFEAALGPGDAPLASAWYGVSPAGNTEDGRSVLTARADAAGLAAAHGVSEALLRQHIERARLRLLAVRDTRPAPATDTKVLTGWNALAIEALARAGTALAEPAWVTAAEAAAAFILATVRCETNRGARLAHHWAGGAVGVPAFCDDTACFANACVTLYEATLNERWALEAVAQCDVLVADFADPSGGGFFQSAAYHEPLAARQKDIVDAATPSGNAAAALALLRVDALRDERTREGIAIAALQATVPALLGSPLGFGDTLVAMDALVGGIRTVRMVGNGVADGPLLAAVRARFNVATVVRLGVAGDQTVAAAVASTVAPPLAPPAAPAGPIGEAVEVCVRGRCQRPVHAVAALLDVLAATDAGEA